MFVSAATHIHSEWSYDANWSLAKLVRLFKRFKYNTLLMAEHDKTFDDNKWEQYCAACKKESADGFLVVPGIEYSDPTNTIHIQVWGKDVPFFGHDKATEEILISVKKYGCVSVLSHPMRKEAYRLFKKEWFQILDGIEEWNRKFDGIAPPDGINTVGEQYCLAQFWGLDFHQLNQFVPLLLKIEITGELSYDNVLSSLKNKDCYPQILGLSKEKSRLISKSNKLKKLENYRQSLRPFMNQIKGVFN